MKLMPRKIKTLIALALILTSTVLTLSFPPKVKAEVNIISVTPTSGYVYDSIQVIANITVENGPYTILFDEITVDSGTAVGTLVDVSFPVPHTVSGMHNITVRDETSEATANFTVLTKYSIGTDAPEPPEQLQQNSTIGIFLNVTGGESNLVYSANVTVRTPANTTYWMNFSLVSTTEPGHHNATITYPSTGWTPSNQSTNYTGTYIVSWLNGTEILKNTTFFIGLTNSTKYHRGDVVDIKAVDYPPEQNVTITISGVDVSYSVPPFNATADVDGVVHTNWNVTSDAPVGNYSLSITPVPSSKLIANDTQIFEVPGFKTEIFTLNLANETVPSVFVRAHDESADARYNTTSTEDGLASFMFERGNYGCEAFFKEVRVGEVNFTITETKQVNFTCQLTSLNIKVIDAQNVSIPEVSISLTYNYTTNLDVKENRTETEFGETNITGTSQLRSLLPNVTYIINASRYEKVFNQNTVSELSAQAYFDVTIFCPAETLHVNVTDALNQPIINATVKVQEWMGGLCYNETTDENGKAVLSCTFGRYFVKVYVGEILLNETKTLVDLFQNQNVSIICKLYGLTVSFKVVDYFGQPISNAKVTLRREGLPQSSKFTESDGTATFNNVIGRNLNVIVHLNGQMQPCATATYSVEETKTIEIRIGKYVVLAGFLVETSQFTTAIIIAATVMLVLSLEVYRRRRLKPQKTSS